MELNVTSLISNSHIDIQLLKQHTFQLMKQDSDETTAEFASVGQRNAAINY